MAKTIRCTIVTPQQSVLDDEVTYASFPAHDGQHGVMPGQSPLLSRLGVGSLRLDFPEGGSRWYLVDGGFAQVQGNELTVLTEYAKAAETLSLSEAEAELAEANARVTQSEDDAARVQHDQARAMAKVTLAKQQAARGGAI